MAKSMGSGWHLESNRHSLASKGIKTGTKREVFAIWYDRPNQLPRYKYVDTIKYYKDFDDPKKAESYYDKLVIEEKKLDAGGPDEAAVVLQDGKTGEILKKYDDREYSEEEFADVVEAAKTENPRKTWW